MNTLGSASELVRKEDTGLEGQRLPELGVGG